MSKRWLAKANGTLIAEYVVLSPLAHSYYMEQRSGRVLLSGRGLQDSDIDQWSWLLGIVYAHSWATAIERMCLVNAKEREG